MMKLLSTIGLSSLFFVSTAFAGEEPASSPSRVALGESNSFERCVAGYNAVYEAILPFSSPKVPMPTVSAQEVCTIATSRDVLALLQDELRNPANSPPPGSTSGTSPGELYEKIKSWFTTEAKKIKIRLELAPEPQIVAKFEMWSRTLPADVELLGGRRVSGGIFGKQGIGDDSDFDAGIYGQIDIGSHGFARAEIGADGDTRLMFGIGIGF